jgi:hypothetical protein
MRRLARLADKDGRKVFSRSQQAEDDGKSERPPVMGGIGDETIAPTRKCADFHLVICRKTGL